MGLLVRRFCIALMTLCCSIHSYSQLERVIVERYYVADANDATDVTGGGIPEGSVTYRIFIDLKPGTALKGIYGNLTHPFSISSTDIFFNNIADGQTFAKDFIRSRYEENTVALDTWLTLGQTAKKQGNLAYYGILKEQDTNGSFIGGVNNDGGSEVVSTGLLINNDPSIGLALTVADGMDTLSSVPSNWFNNGILDFTSGQDSTMFGSIVERSGFYSENFALSNSGTYGQIPDSNQIIIAQLTTLGELSFQINIEVEYEVDGVATTIYYVGNNEVANDHEIYSPYLSYPYSCGCNNPEFLEYDPSFICYQEGTCNTPVVIGCMDTLACNYDPVANFNFDALCCYPGWCNGRNIEEACPQLMGNSFDIKIYPNPASDVISLNVLSGIGGNLKYVIYNSWGVEMKRGSVSDAPLNYSVELNVSDLTNGIYQLKVISDLGEEHKLFVKL